MSMQNLIDEMSAAWRTDREKHHLTLGRLIAALDAVPGETVVQFSDGSAPGKPESYRGYYSDISLPPETRLVTAANLLAQCRGVLGSTLTGYKGGDYLMDARTPLWSSCYGECSNTAIVDFKMDGGSLILQTAQIED